jgi:hypothetical protein
MIIYLPLSKTMFVINSSWIQVIFFGDSSFGANKIFHVLDIPHEICAISRKFGLFHEMRYYSVIAMWAIPR